LHTYSSVDSFEFGEHVSTEGGHGGPPLQYVP
jgi:hypothetical protein